MRYRVYLYGTKAEHKALPVVNWVNRAVAAHEDREWKAHGADHRIAAFDAEAVLRQIEETLTVAGICKCRPLVEYAPVIHGTVAYLKVVTSYEKAAEVLPKLYAIAAEHDLVLYDAETDRTFFRDLVDRGHIDLRLRERELYRAILREMQPLWKIRSIPDPAEEGEHRRFYVVTLRKDPQVSFEERNEKLYRCLKANLKDEEKLTCSARYYRIDGPRYTIRYAVEGYKKNADRFGSRKYGISRSIPLLRMGTEAAWRWMEGCTEMERDDILARMRFTEMRKAYPNPAQRLAESIRITKWQRKQPFDIRYSGVGLYGSEIVFRAVPWRTNDSGNLSALKIEEESATFLLPFIEEFYPYLYDRYYLTENHLPWQTWRDILDRLKEVRETILRGDDYSALRPRLKEFNLYVLAETGQKIDDEEVFIRQHRYEIAGLYDAFIQWSEAQMEAYRGSDDLMFSIMGP
ncbi:MAG: hypothetical protein IJA84_00030 [Clostridia bacterium]|nr:hypothetical protein [Clostridia bacterium]